MVKFWNQNRWNRKERWLQRTRITRMLTLYLPLKDDVTTFATLEPTNRIQHVVCEAKNEVRHPLIKRNEKWSQFKTRWPQCLCEVRSLLLQQQCPSQRIPRTPQVPRNPWTPRTLPPLQTIIKSTRPNLPGLKPRRTRGGRYWGFHLKYHRGQKT